MRTTDTLWFTFTLSIKSCHWAIRGVSSKNLQQFLQYPERFAQEALGYNSKAVHWAYQIMSQAIYDIWLEWQKVKNFEFVKWGEDKF